MVTNHTNNVTRKIRFVTLVRSHEEARRASLLIQSLRAFGGHLRNCPLWVFQAGVDFKSWGFQEIDDVQVFPLAVEDEYRNYYFADKVEACARAEAMAVSEEVRSLVWINSAALVVQPPDLFDLSPVFEAAFRPVHVQNIGLDANDPLDEYWEGVYKTAGIRDTSHTVQSYLDSIQLRPYFNSHLFSINPAKGVLQAWSFYFKKLVSDQTFQSGAVRDEEHKIFLHQVILSALVVKSLEWELVRLLPPEYSYPLHFHQEIPEERRPVMLNSLVCPVYEGAYRYPDSLGGIKVDEPLLTWLQERSPA